MSCGKFVRIYTISPIHNFVQIVLSLLFIYFLLLHPTLPFCLQKRNVRTNLWLISFPILICVLLVLLQTVVNRELDKPSRRCGCTCIDTNGDGKCERKCGIEYSTLNQAGSCPLPSPPEWPPLLQIPRAEYRAVENDFITYKDLPEESCKTTGSCPAAVLLTGANQTFAERMLIILESYMFQVDLLLIL